MKPIIELLPYRSAVATDSSTNLQMLIRIQAPMPKQQKKRPPLNLALAIDTSGSMGGDPIEHAKRAAILMVQQLRPDDRISVVTFDNAPNVLVANRAVADPVEVIERISRLQAGGGTALHGGWLQACQECEKATRPTILSRVVLLSDGGANVGISDPTRIAHDVAEQFEQGIATTTIGLGLHYNEDLMQQMASAGNGNIYHVQDPEEITSIFTIELQGMSATFGRTVSLGIEPRSGVELLQVFNRLKKTPSGRLKLADLVRGCPLEVVCEFLVPPQAGKNELADFRVAWTDRDTGERRHLHRQLKLPAVAQGRLCEFTANEEVLQKRAIQLSAQAQRQAVKAIDRQDFGVARDTIKMALGVLAEVDSTAEVNHQTRVLEGLIRGLDNGAYNQVRKSCSSSSVSVSMSSIVLSSGVREFMKLPPEERTPEKLQELMGQNHLNSEAS